MPVSAIDLLGRLNGFGPAAIVGRGANADLNNTQTVQLGSLALACAGYDWSNSNPIGSRFRARRSLRSGLAQKTWANAEWRT